MTLPKQMPLFHKGLVIVLLFIAGFLVRVPFLSVHPPGLWYDEAINGLDGLSVLGYEAPFYSIRSTPHARIFFTTENHPREPFYMYLVAFLYLFLDPTVFSLRLASVIAGAAAVPALFLLVRCFTGNRKQALFAALVLLSMRWHIHHSRLALRSILVPLWTVLSFWSIYAALFRKQIWGFIAAGAILGLGFYTHLAFRFVPFILIIFLWHLYRTGRFREKRERRGLVIYGFTAAAFFLPLGIDYLFHPFHFFGRAGEVSLFNEGVGRGLLEILKNTGSSLAMFSFLGDKNPLLNLPGAPVFTPLASLFFYLGIYVSAKRAARGDPLSFLVFPWLGVMLLGTILSTDAPHFSRSLGACIPAAVFAAFGLDEATEWCVDFFRRRRGLFCGAALIAIISLWDLSLYYGKYREVKGLFYRTNAAWVEVAREGAGLISGDPGNPPLVYLPGVMYRHPSVVYLTLGISREKLRPMTFPEAIEKGEGDRLEDHVLLATSQNRLYRILSKEIPTGRVIREFRTPEGNTWALFYLVPGSELPGKEGARALVRRYSPTGEW